MKPPPFEYHDPRTLDAALALLARHGDEAKVLAGGQSLMPMLNFRLARPGIVIDINQIKQLNYISGENGSVRLGALTRQRVLERWSATRAPLLAETLRHVGHIAIRTRGTVGGSLAHADPAAELPALLLCLDGSVAVRSAAGEREVQGRELFTGPLTTSLRSDELLVEVRLPGPPSGWGFVEVSRRHGDFALAGAVATVALAGERIAQVRMSLFGCGPVPLRAARLERALSGVTPAPAVIEDAVRAEAGALAPDSDVHASADYRRRVAATLMARALTAAVDRARSTP